MGLDATAEPGVSASDDAKFGNVGAARFERALLAGWQGGSEKAHVNRGGGIVHVRCGEREVGGDRRDRGARANEGGDVVAEGGGEVLLDLRGEFPAVG